MTRVNRTSNPPLWVLLALLSRLSPVVALSVGWVYRDLAFDRPTYSVQFLQEPLRLSSIVPNSHHPTTCALHSDNLLAARNVHSTVVMTKPDGSRWSCRVPSAPSNTKNFVKRTSQEIEKEEQGHINRGLTLLDPLEGKCLIASYRSWTYEFCYKGAIRQYYEADTDENRQPHKYAPVYVLGRFRPLLEGPKSLEEHKDTKLVSWSRKEAKTEFETKHDRNYLVQTWEHGDICILTNQPRQIRVHYQCALIPEDRIHAVTEPTICSYVIVINSPRLCIDPAFRVIRPPAPEPIQCTPIFLDTKKASVGKTGTRALITPQRIAQLSGHMLKVHQMEEAPRLQNSENGNGGNSKPAKKESESGKALLGYFGSLQLTSFNYPLETANTLSGTKDSASEHLQGEELDHRIPSQLSNMMAEIDVEVLEQKDQGSLNEYSEHIKKSIKNGGRIPIYDKPQEELSETLEEAKDGLEDQADAEEDILHIDEKLTE
ncbi:Protein OS-9 [Podila verticillata]|nr:Protein OS-9 [Podila verticillata]